MRRSRSRFVLLLFLSAGALLAACAGGKHAKPTVNRSGALPYPLPPGFAAVDATPLPSPVGTLDVKPVGKLEPAQLQKGPLPSSHVTSTVQAIVNRAVTTTVRPLLIDHRDLREGESVTVAAGDLALLPAHDVLFILQGPVERFERLVRASSGVSAGRVTLPTRLSPGIWGLAVEDVSEVRLKRGQAPTGSVLLDLAIFTVPS